MNDISFTSNFNEFKKKVSFLGDLDILKKKHPDVYCHMVLSHGFIEYVIMKKVEITKENYLKWAKDNNLTELIEEGWKAFCDD